MAGNEVAVCKFLLLNSENAKLKHIGELNEIAAPSKLEEYEQIRCVDDLIKVSTSDARKKADVYLNGLGVSIKQRGASVLYNRLQRVNLKELYSRFNFIDINKKIHQLDFEISQFHQGKILRDRLWQDFFVEEEFKELLRFLMLQGSPNYGFSNYPAKFILEAPSQINAVTDIQIYSFDEYFDKYKHNIKIAIRRSWIGQFSKSEHQRALTLSSKLGNEAWVFSNVTSNPRKWRTDFPISNRKTVYYVSITKCDRTSRRRNTT